MDNLNIQNPASFPRRDSVRVSNALIENISISRGMRQITISHSDCRSCPSQRVVLNVDQNTIIQDERGNQIPLRDLQVGMTVDATFSSAMTRSIPPQAQAFRIRIVRRQPQRETTTGVILDINQRNRSLTTISNRNPASIIQFNTTQDTVILDRNGRNIPFSRLMPGTRVRIEHANFMTASIPPQTTPFLIQLL